MIPCTKSGSNMLQCLKYKPFRLKKYVMPLSRLESVPRPSLNITLASSRHAYAGLKRVSFLCLHMLHGDCCQLQNPRAKEKLESDQDCLSIMAFTPELGPLQCPPETHNKKRAKQMPMQFKKCSIIVLA